MFVKIHPVDPEPRLVKQVVDCLKVGGIIIYPTDSVYGLGCDIENKKAVERLCQIRGLDPAKAHLTCVCESAKILGDYAINISTPLYKIIRQAFPGPYTFILQASKKIPRHFQTKNTVGIRVADHPIPLAIVKELGNPIASISLTSNTNGEDNDYLVDPDQIFQKFGKIVDMIVDGGMGKAEPTTILDCSKGVDQVVLVRQGAGDLASLGIEVAE